MSQHLHGSPKGTDHNPAATNAGHQQDTRLPYRPSKVQICHLERRAVVYIRQSTPQQVIENRESTDRQYSLVHRAIDLGWPASGVEVIDEDQGLSGTTTEGRLGFQRLLAEIGLDNVGIILGLEMSRLARSNRDWHQLLELCAIFRTLLADQDGLYDPTDYNDRLLLGLKGTMSEAELHVLRGRMQAGRLNKARRGELLSIPPIGYIKLPTGEFAIDPDEQVQAVVRLVFDQFDRIGCVRGVIRYLVHHGICIGVRPHYGPNRGNLEWRHPSRGAVQSILTHQIYAGMYRHGCRQIDPRRKKPGKPASGRVMVSPDQYVALIPDKMPAYIPVERYEANQKRLAANRARLDGLGIPREGPSLLGGLLFCGRCGARLAIQYSGKSQILRYLCRRAQDACRGPRCQSLVGRVLDELIAEQVLMALQPAALELSMAAADDLQQERHRLTENWQQRLERARYQTDRAERQYQAVEPENRLIARELERRWEAALKEQQQLEGEYDKFCRTQPTELSAKERGRIMALAQDLPAIWQATTTTPADRQRIIRLLLTRVIVNVQDGTDHVAVTLEWAGGFTSKHELIRPVQGYRQQADFGRLIGRIEELRAAGLSMTQIAETINREGFHPVKPRDRFDGRMVVNIFAKYGSTESKRRVESDKGVLQKNEWWARDLAEKLKLSKGTVHRWVRLGWIHFRRLPGPQGQVACWADAGELSRLRKLRNTRHGWWDPPLPAELTTPKPRPEDQR